MEDKAMKNGPLFPYKNLFITARPGMGATTVVLNIVKKYMDQGKKCLIFSDAGRLSEHYIERVQALHDGCKRNLFVTKVEKYGDLAVIDCNNLMLDSIINYVNNLKGFQADVVVIDEPICFALTDADLIFLSDHFKKEEIVFIFVTHIRREISLLTQEPKNVPSASLHKKAMRSFEAVAVVYRNGFRDEVDELIEEIRIYERGKRKYIAVPVEFDFERQSVKRK